MHEGENTDDDGGYTEVPKLVGKPKWKSIPTFRRSASTEPEALPDGEFACHCCQKVIKDNMGLANADIAKNCIISDVCIGDKI
jgi:hypothetical protein